MKQRVISSAVALVLLFIVLVFFNTYVFNVVVAAIIAMAIFELLHAEGCVKDWFLTAAACLYGGALPLIPQQWVLRVFPLLTLAYVAALFLVLLARHNDISALQIGFTFFISIVIPFSMATSVYMRDIYGAQEGLFYILVALSAAWISDTGGFFVGRAFGKHPLAPVISPKKTVEGSIGGILSCMVFMPLLGLIYQWGAQQFFGIVCSISYIPLILAAPLLSVCGMLGDLSASVIKRQSNIKDYGNIMPGHGGVVDRFDSVFFTAPTVFVLSRLVSLITVR